MWPPEPIGPRPAVDHGAVMGAGSLPPNRQATSDNICGAGAHSAAVAHTAAAGSLGRRSHFGVDAVYGVDAVHDATAAQGFLTRIGAVAAPTGIGARDKSADFVSCSRVGLAASWLTILRATFERPNRVDPHIVPEAFAQIWATLPQYIPVMAQLLLQGAVLSAVFQPYEVQIRAHGSSPMCDARKRNQSRARHAMH